MLFGLEAAARDRVAEGVNFDASEGLDVDRFIGEDFTLWELSSDPKVRPC